MSVAVSSLEAVLDHQGRANLTVRSRVTTSHGKPAGNPAARTVQQRGARNAQLRQRQPKPVNPEPPDEEAEADGE
jgi:hypothetical protein